GCAAHGPDRHQAGGEKLSSAPDACAAGIAHSPDGRAARAAAVYPAQLFRESGGSVPQPAHAGRLAVRATDAPGLCRDVIRSLLLLRRSSSEYGRAPMTSSIADLEPHCTNWAGNLRYSADNLDSPRTLDDLREIVRSSRKVRALGSRHSFNGIADSDA